MGAMSIFNAAMLTISGSYFDQPEHSHHLCHALGFSIRIHTDALTAGQGCHQQRQESPMAPNALTQTSHVTQRIQ